MKCNMKEIKRKLRKRKIQQIIKKAIQFITNPRLLLCVGLAWMITNGWAYVLLGLGTAFGIGWMIAVAGAYLSFLWLPITPEKVITMPIAIGLLRLLFPNDEKTLGILNKAKDKAVEEAKKIPAAARKIYKKIKHKFRRRKK